MLSQWCKKGLQVPFQRRFVASKAVPVTEPLPNVPQHAEGALSPAVSKLSILSNGVRVASVNSHQPGSSVGVFVNAGSRDDHPDYAGTAFFLSRMGYKSTFTRSPLRVNRQIEVAGGTYDVRAGRETISYVSSVGTNEVAEVLPVLADIVQNPRLIWHEYHDVMEQSGLLIEQHQSNPQNVLLDYLHQEAFRNKGLGNPLVTPSYSLHDITTDVLRSFLETNYGRKNITVVATGGVEHETLVKWSEQYFTNNRAGNQQRKASEYFGGDVRVPTSGATHLAIGFKGVALGEQDVYAAGILQHLLGSYNRTAGTPPAPVVGGASRLGRNILDKHSWVHDVNALNLHYSDAGIFAVTAVAERGHVEELATSITREISKILSGSIDAAEINRARALFKAHTVAENETRPSLLNFVAKQAAFGTQIATPAEFIKKADSVTEKDLRNVATKIFKSKPTLVVVGDVRNAPTVESIQKLL